MYFKVWCLPAILQHVALSVVDFFVHPVSCLSTRDTDHMTETISTSWQLMAAFQQNHYIRKHTQGLTRSSTRSLMAVMPKTSTNGTRVVYHGSVEIWGMIWHIQTHAFISQSHTFIWFTKQHEIETNPVHFQFLCQYCQYQYLRKYDQPAGHYFATLTVWDTVS